MNFLQGCLCLGLMVLSTGTLHAFVADTHSENDSGLLRENVLESFDTKVIRPQSAKNPTVLESDELQSLEVLRDKKSNSVRLLQGNFEDVQTLNTREGSVFVEVSKNYVDRHSEVFGVSSRDLRELSSAQFMGKDEQFVRFHVYRNGVRIKDASVDFRFKFGKLQQIATQTFSEAKYVPMGERTDLLQKAEQLLNAKVIVPANPLYRVVETDSGYQLEKVASFAVRSEKDMPYNLELDVVSGKIYELSRKFYNFQGKAEGEVYPRWYDEQLSMIPFRHLDVQSTKGTVRTSLTGEFAADADAAPQVQDGLNGQYVNVRDQNGNHIKAPAVNVNDFWQLQVRKDAAQQAWMDTRIAQTMIYDKTTAIVERAKKYVDMPWFSRVLTANANLNSHCNAYWDGNTINMFTGNAQCANTGLIADVVYHEWGHGMHHNAEGIEDGALSEGFGDIMSLVMTHSNLLGIGFLLANRGPVRDIKPPKIYPRDRGEVHAEGMIIASTFWELFEKLTLKYGEETAGDMLANYAFKMIFTTRSYLDAYRALLVIDSNGDISKGTPNLCLLNEVFVNHGLATKDAACELASIDDWEVDGSTDTILKPGKTMDIRLKAKNAASQALTGLEGTLSINDLPGAVVEGGKLQWDEIPTGAAAMSRNAVRLSIPGDAACGRVFHANVALKAGARELSLSKEWLLGRNEGQPTNFAATGLPLVIKDYQTVTATLPASNPAWSADTTTEAVELAFDIRHTFLGDIAVSLKSPEGDTVEVYRGSGRGSGSVSFRQAVQGFKGKKITGNWELVVKDTAGGDEGTLTSFSLVLTPAIFNCH